MFNCTLSTARRLVECTFGILGNKWQSLRSSTLVRSDTAVDIVKSCCALQNFVRRRDGYVFEDYLTCDNDFGTSSSCRRAIYWNYTEGCIFAKLQQHWRYHMA